MSAFAWFLAEAAVPVAIGAAFALAVDVARRPPVRHYRWRNKRWLRREVPLIELRSRVCVRGGSEPETGSGLPHRSLVSTAGVEPSLAGAPPATPALVDAVSTPAAASTRPRVLRIGGRL